MRRALLIVAGAALAAPSAQAQPVGRWISGFGQGMHEAVVRDVRWQEVRFSCPTPQQTRFPPAVTLTVQGRGAESEGRLVLFDVGGRSIPVEMRRQPAAEPGRVEYRLEATDDASRARMVELVRALSGGGRLVIGTPDDGGRHGFSLRGSAEALAGCPRA